MVANTTLHNELYTHTLGQYVEHRHLKTLCAEQAQLLVYPHTTDKSLLRSFKIIFKVTLHFLSTVEKAVNNITAELCSCVYKDILMFQ